MCSCVLKLFYTNALCTWKSPSWSVHERWVGIGRHAATRQFRGGEILQIAIRPDIQLNRAVFQNMWPAINIARAVSIYLNTETVNTDTQNKAKQTVSSSGTYKTLWLIFHLSVGFIYFKIYSQHWSLVCMLPADTSLLVCTLHNTLCLWRGKSKTPVTI